MKNGGAETLSVELRTVGLMDGGGETGVAVEDAASSLRLLILLGSVSVAGGVTWVPRS